MPNEYEDYLKRVMNVFMFRVQTDTRIPETYYGQIMESTMQYTQACFDAQFALVWSSVLYDLWCGLIPEVLTSGLIGIPKLYYRSEIHENDEMVVLSIDQYIGYLDTFSEWISTSDVSGSSLHPNRFRNAFVSAFVTMPDVPNFKRCFEKYGMMRVRVDNDAVVIDPQYGADISVTWQHLLGYIADGRVVLPVGVTINTLRKFLFFIVYKLYVFQARFDVTFNFCLRWLGLFKPASENRFIYPMLQDLRDHAGHINMVMMNVSIPVQIGSTEYSHDPRPAHNHEHQTRYEVYWVWEPVLRTYERTVIQEYLADGLYQLRSLFAQRPFNSERRFTGSGSTGVSVVGYDGPGGLKKIDLVMVSTGEPKCEYFIRTVVP
jgi:hypothetical protein